MINVMIPAGGKSFFFSDLFFPKPLIEIDGKTMIEHVIGNYKGIDDVHFVFAFEKKDCTEFHLDDSVRILTNNQCEVLVLENETQGALCTCLMGIEQIDDDIPLIIANCDQIIDVDYSDVIKKFEDEKRDVGMITFDSIHPRWSYAKMKGNNVVEVAEKRPLSKHAIAGFFYYHMGGHFIEAAKEAIIKDNSYNGRFYISATVNELLLKNKSVGYYEIERNRYHSFYSPEKIKEYEISLGVVR